MIGTTQIPASIDKDFLGNATLIHTGHLVYPEDTRAVAKAMRTEKGAIAPARLNREGHADGQTPRRASGILTNPLLKSGLTDYILGGVFMPHKLKRTWQLQEAKARLSHVVAEAKERGPQTITVHGEASVVVVSIEEYRRFAQPRESLVEFFRRSPLAGVRLKVSRSKDAGRHRLRF